MNTGHAARAGLLLLPSLLFIGLYWPSLDHEFVWTDQGEIVHGIVIQPRDQLLAAFVQPMHPNLDALSPGAEQPYYRPLQVVVASLVDAEFGRRPRAFRSVTLALGALSMVVFTALAWWLFRDPLLAVIAGGIAAAHPVGIEMYVWIAGLSGALAHLAVLLSLLSAALALSVRGASRAALAVLSGVALLAGLLSKESAVVTPVLLAALWICRFAGTRAESQEGGARRFAAGLLAAQLALVLSFSLAWRPTVLGENLAGGAPIADSFAVHVFTSLASWPGRLGWLFAPIQSSTSDVVRIASSLFDPMTLLGLFLALVSLPLSWRLLNSGRPVTAFGIAWVWIAFLPTSGLIPLTHMRAERYLALSVFGAALLCTSLLPALTQSLAARTARWAIAALGLCTTAFLAERTATRIPDWRTNLVLFERDVERDPLFREGYYILAKSLAEQDRFEEASRRLAELRALGPHFTGLSSFLRTQDAVLLQCRVNRMLGDDAATAEMLGEELRADSEDLPYAPQLFLCGARSLEALGRFEEELAIAERVRDLRPGVIEPYAALVAVRAQIQLGRTDAAKRALAAIPADALRGAELATELRQLKALLRSHEAASWRGR